MDRNEARRRAEQELALAKQASDEASRRAHFLRAGILFNLGEGGDPDAKGRAGYTY